MQMLSHKELLLKEKVRLKSGLITLMVSLNNKKYEIYVRKLTEIAVLEAFDLSEILSQRYEFLRDVDDSTIKLLCFYKIMHIFYDEPLKLQDYSRVVAMGDRRQSLEPLLYNITLEQFQEHFNLLEEKCSEFSLKADAKSQLQKKLIDVRLSYFMSTQQEYLWQSLWVSRTIVLHSYKSEVLKWLMDHHAVKSKSAFGKRGKVVYKLEISLTRDKYIFLKKVCRRCFGEKPWKTIVDASKKETGNYEQRDIEKLIKAASNLSESIKEKSYPFLVKVENNVIMLLSFYLVMQMYYDDPLIFSHYSDCIRLGTQLHPPLLKQISSEEFKLLQSKFTNIIIRDWKLKLIHKNTDEAHKVDATTVNETELLIESYSMVEGGFKAKPGSDPSSSEQTDTQYCVGGLWSLDNHVVQPRNNASASPNTTNHESADSLYISSPDSSVSS